jgi:hypothetical protein
MPVRFFERRTIWFPTLMGWLAAAFCVCIPATGWFLKGESFLAVTGRLPAEVLVVEGWIGGEGIKAAFVEFQNGGYRVVVSAGGLTGERWSKKRWNYAAEAEEQLLLLGVPRDRVLLASSRDVEIQRTFEMAVAARKSIDAAGLNPIAINVFTRGAHARRSRLIFEKVFSPDTKVGVISWKPPLFEAESWWESSDRAQDLIKETTGYLYELLVDSGRRIAAMGVPDVLSLSKKGRGCRIRRRPDFEKDATTKRYPIIRHAGLHDADSRS